MSELALKLIQEAKEKKSKVLDLGNCGLTGALPDELFELEWLETLNLGSEYFDIISGDLLPSNNEGARNDDLNLDERFSSLIHLKSLSIFGINNTDAQYINNIQLTHLIIQGGVFDNYQISNLDFIKRLKNITHLDISSNYIDDIHPLSNLKNLIYLDLSGEYLWHSDIKDISPLKSLINIKKIILKHNQIEDITPLKNLSNLEYINIADNPISDISPLKKLYKTKFINISNGDDLDSGFDLDTENQFKKGHGRIKDISPLKNLPQLETINLNGNIIEDLSPLKEFIRKGIEINPFVISFTNSISINRNPITTPPPEIIQQGHEAILNYFDEIEKGIGKIYEAKMIIVGEGGAGKTSLALKLEDMNQPLPKEEETTRGIEIQPLKFDCGNGQEFTINMWDFGGQEIYHSTHQFFLTKRSLYLLVDDTRKDDKKATDASFKYWLETVGMHSGNSPLLIIQNEKGGRSKDIDLQNMQKQFHFIKEKYSTNLLTGKGLEKIEKAIHHHIQQLPHIGETLPKKWVAIRKKLIELSKQYSYISSDKYYEICKENNIPEKKRALHLSQYLHDLGTFLHFQEDPLLKKTIILQNEWATQAVYRLLDDESTKENRGIFLKKDAGRLWFEEAYSDMHDDLLQLMEKFELCYALNSKKSKYIIPQLLPESQPKHFTWDDKNNIRIIYRYGFMPKGLLSRFFVRSNMYVKNIKKAWKNGVVLQLENTEALVQETYAKNEIVIKGKGSHARDLLSIIASKMDELNAEFEGIKVEKFIPCNCEECSQSQKPYYYKYSSILRRIEKKKPTVECDYSYIDVPVTRLRDAVFNDSYHPDLPTSNIIKEIRSLIESNHIDQAFQLVGKHIKEKDRQEFTLLQNRWKQLQDDKRNGIVSQEVSGLEHRQIIHSFNQFIELVF